MDDSTLKSLKLIAKSSKTQIDISPPFSRQVKSYSSVAQSDLDSVIIQATCNEPDAFCQPQHAASDGSIAIKEEENTVEIKVDAVDGSSSKYVIHIYRPSASDTSLKDIHVSSGTLVPLFHRHESQYVVHVDPSCDTITVSATPLNTKSTLHPSEKTPTQLGIGDTQIKLKVTSADTTKTSIVTVTVRKDKIGGRCGVISAGDNTWSSLVCSVCKSVLFRPRKTVLMTDTPKCTHTFCLTCFDLFKIVTTTTSSTTTQQQGQSQSEPYQVQVYSCPLCVHSEMMLPPLPPLGTPTRGAFANTPLTDPDTDTETRIAKNITVSCPFTRFGCTTGTSLPMADLARHVKTCQHAPGACTECGASNIPSSLLINTKHKETCTFTCTSCGVKVATRDSSIHSTLCTLKSNLVSEESQLKSPPSTWESAYIDHKTQWTTPTEACNAATQSWIKYVQSLTRARLDAEESSGTRHTTPDMSLLDTITRAYATAISINTSAKKTRGVNLDAILHMNLGMVIEETWICHTMFDSITHTEKSSTNHTTQSRVTENEEASESFMADEVTGLLLQLGVSPSATDATKIKAMETEYHRLLEQGMCDQAAEVQGLHAWKVKQVSSMVGGGGGGASDTSNDTDNSIAMSAGGNGLLLRALEKYLDAVRINPSNAEANLHLGRTLILLNRHEDAIKYLKIALSIYPMSTVTGALLSTAIAGAIMSMVTRGVTVPQPLRDETSEAIRMLTDHLNTIHTGLWSPMREDLALIHGPWLRTSPTQESTPNGVLNPNILLCTNMHHPSHPLVTDMFLYHTRLCILSGNTTMSTRDTDTTTSTTTTTSAVLDILHILPEIITKLPKHSALYQRQCLRLCEAQTEWLIWTISLSPPQPHPSLSQHITASSIETLRSLTRRITHGTTDIIDTVFMSRSCIGHQTLSCREHVAQTLVSTSVSTSTADAFALACLGETQFDSVDLSTSPETSIQKLKDAETSFIASLAILNQPNTTFTPFVRVTQPGGESKEVTVTDALVQVSGVSVESALAAVRAQSWWITLDRLTTFAKTASTKPTSKQTASTTSTTKPKPKASGGSAVTSASTNTSSNVKKVVVKPNTTTTTASKPVASKPATSKPAAASPTIVDSTTTTAGKTDTPIQEPKPVDQPNIAVKNASTTKTKGVTVSTPTAAKQQKPPASTPSASKPNTNTSTPKPNTNTSTSKQSKETPTTKQTSTKPVSTPALTPPSIPSDINQQETAQSQQKTQAALYKACLGLARTWVSWLSRQPTVASTPPATDTHHTMIIESVSKAYHACMTVAPTAHDAYIELGAFLEAHTPQTSQTPQNAGVPKHINIDALTRASQIYTSYPFTQHQTESPSQDDMYLHTEITRTLTKLAQYKHPSLITSLIAQGRVSGIKSISECMDMLDAAGENQVLMQVYSGVNRKPLNDPDLVAFFKAKFWL